MCKSVRKREGGKVWQQWHLSSANCYHLTPSPPHTLITFSSPRQPHSLSRTQCTSPTITPQPPTPHTITLSPPHTPPYRHIHSLPPSPPSSPRHLHSLTRTQCTSPTITPQPPTPHTITSHPLTPPSSMHTLAPPSSMHTLALHARPRTTPLPQQVQDGVDRTELRHMPSGGIAARSLDRVPAPRTNGHHHQHAQRHVDHRARAWL